MRARFRRLNDCFCQSDFATSQMQQSDTPHPGGMKHTSILGWLSPSERNIRMPSIRQYVWFTFGGRYCETFPW